MTKREKRLMRVLDANIKDANKKGSGKGSSANAWAWRCIARQLENLRERFKAILV